MGPVYRHAAGKHGLIISREEHLAPAVRTRGLIENEIIFDAVALLPGSQGIVLDDEEKILERNDHVEAGQAVRSELERSVRRKLPVILQALARGCRDIPEFKIVAQRCMHPRGRKRVLGPGHGRGRADAGEKRHEEYEGCYQLFHIRSENTIISQALQPPMKEKRPGGKDALKENLLEFSAAKYYYALSHHRFIHSFGDREITKDVQSRQVFEGMQARER